jgi:hypothetical protein
MIGVKRDLVGSSLKRMSKVYPRSHFTILQNTFYERKVQTSETLIEVAMIRLLVARLGRPA